MADPKIIAVIGATGAQGGGLVRAILRDKNGGFAARAVTRNPDSDKAKALAKAGAEVVAADTGDQESLERAFAGAHGAFCVTNFWEHFSPERELADATNMAKAAKQAGVRHVIWSTLEDTRKWVPLSRQPDAHAAGQVQGPPLRRQGRGRRRVPETRRADHVSADVVLLGELSSSSARGRSAGPDGKLAITFPMDDKKLPAIAVEDIGKVAYAIFKRGQEFIGKTVAIAGEQLTGAQMRPRPSRGRWAKTCATTPSHPTSTEASASPAPTTWATCSSSSGTFRRPSAARAIPRSRARLNPELQTFDQWLKENKSRIPLE